MKCLNCGEETEAYLCFDCNNLRKQGKADIFPHSKRRKFWGLVDYIILSHILKLINKAYESYHRFKKDTLLSCRYGCENCYNIKCKKMQGKH